MSKAAVDKFTQCLAQELAPKGIRVNAVKFVFFFYFFWPCPKFFKKQFLIKFALNRPYDLKIYLNYSPALIVTALHMRAYMSEEEYKDVRTNNFLFKKTPLIKVLWTWKSRTCFRTLWNSWRSCYRNSLPCKRCYFYNWWIA